MGNCHARICFHFSVTPNKYFTDFDAEKINNLPGVVYFQTYTFYIVSMLCQTCRSDLEIINYIGKFYTVTENFFLGFLSSSMIKTSPKASVEKRVYFTSTSTSQFMMKDVKAELNSTLCM